MNNNISKKNISRKKLFSSRKFKYGSSAVIFTVVFIVFILLFNVVLSAVSSGVGGMYLDLTSKKIYTVSDMTRTALKDVTLPVEIVFCMDSDKLDSISSMTPIKRLAENYASEFSNIKITYKDAISDQVYFDRYKTTVNDVVTQYSVIVHCPSNNMSVICHAKDFYRLNSSTGAVFAFDGENKFTTSILRTARPTSLKAGFTTGHGENQDLVYYPPLKSLLEENGYEVSSVDLKAIDTKELNSYDLIIICTPQSDFTGVNAEKEGHVNEIAKLNSYLTGSFGNLMVYLDPSVKESLTELREFLSEDWGVDYVAGRVLSDSAQNTSSLFDNYSLLGSYTQDNGLDSTLNSQGAGARPLFDYAVPLKLTFTEKGYKTVKTVAQSSQDSVAVISSSDSEKMPSVPLMTITDYRRSYNEGEKHAYVVVSSSTNFLSVLGSELDNQFSNSDLVKLILKKMGNSNVVANIDFKVFDESALSVTNAQSKTALNILGISIPVAICIAGVAVFLKRKYL